MRTYPVTLTDGQKIHVNAYNAEQAYRLASCRSSPGVYVAVVGNPF